MKKIISLLTNKFSEFFVLFLICAIFYTVLHVSAGAALEKTNTTQAVETISFLRIVASGIFALFLGIMGVKISMRVWPAVFVHSFVVSAMLAFDIPLDKLIIDWNITLFIIGLMAGLTGVSGGLYLGYLWFKHRR